jgi:hypothetical protein
MHKKKIEMNGPVLRVVLFTLSLILAPPDPELFSNLASENSQLLASLAIV